MAARANRGGIVERQCRCQQGFRPIARRTTSLSWSKKFAPLASYFTVDLSSPATPGLRNLQQAAQLDDLLAKVIDARERVLRTRAGDSPVLLKIAPDLSLNELDGVVRIARSRQVDGMMLSSTTLARLALAAQLRTRQRARRAVGTAAVPPGCRPAWWRRPMCGSRARFRWSASMRYRFRWRRAR